MTSEKKPTQPRTRTVFLHFLSLGGKVMANALVEKRIKDSFREYDASGNLMQSVDFTQEGAVHETNTYEYDDSGFRTKWTKRVDQDDYTEVFRYEKGENGQVAKGFKYYADESFDTTTYSYDDQNRVTLVRTADSDDEEEERMEYSYPGENTREKKVFEWGELSGREVVRTEGEDNLVEKVVYDADGDEVEHVNNELENGRIVKSQVEAEGEEYEVSFFYNENGQAIREEHRANEGQQGHDIDRDFGDHGNPVEERQTYFELRGDERSEQLFVRKFEYEWFDDQEAAGLASD